MTIIYEQRQTDSPYIESITHGHTASEGSSIRPAECHWHMVVLKHEGNTRLLVVGPLATSGLVNYGEGAEILWIKFKLGTFMPVLPAKTLRDKELILPDASSKSFWLNGSAWQFPDYENVETFVNKLARHELLLSDPVVSAVLQNQPSNIPDRTVRHRFAHITGLTQNHIYQIERAQRAATLLQQGQSILDTVAEVGYFDQPHLTRALKQWVGHTPAQLLLAK